MSFIVNFNAKLPVKIKRQKKWFYISCPILDIHSQGETEKIAKDNIIDAITLFFMSCYERGTLDQALKDCGFTSIQKKLSPKEREKPSPFKEINVSIPFLFNSRRKAVECQD